MRARFALVLALVLAPALAGCFSASAGNVLVVGATTSVRDSGLLDAITSAYADESGTRVRAVVAGSGEMAERARRGDVHVVLLHAPDVERALLADGVALAREPAMWNRFLVVGSPADPAGITDAADAADAFRRVADARALFASRGDASGTHAKELALWAAARVAPDAREAAWYKETGQGQSGTLRYANEKGAYALTDDATWRTLHAADALPRLAPFHVDDPALVNAYHVLPLHTRADATAFATWLAGPEGARVIAAHAGPDGAPLFTPGPAPAGEGVP